MPQAKVGISGDKELLRAFRKIREDMRDKVAPAAMRGLLRVQVKAMKKEIPPKYKEARKMVRSRFAKKDKFTKKTAAKAGFKVGITKTKQESFRTVSKGNKGVGLGFANLHWFIFGTTDRYRKNGGYTGKMPIIFDRLPEKAWNTSKPAALAKFKELAQKELKRQIAKRRAKAKAK